MFDTTHQNEPEEEINDLDDNIEPELEEIDEMATDKIKDLRTKLKSCESEKAAHLEELQRAKADFLNAKKRLEEEKVSDRQRTRVRFVEELLPLCDSFHMAMQNQDAWNAVDQIWRTGVESIHSQLEAVLASHGVEKIVPLGEQFDPSLHEAVSSEPVHDEAKHHTITTVIQPGYKMTVDGTAMTIRPARVVVGELTQN